VDARKDQHGTAWQAAIDYGIDVSLLEENLRLTPDERFDQLVAMQRLYDAVRAERVEPLCNLATLEGFWNLDVTTALGRLNLLGETPIGDYARLAECAVTMTLAGVSVQVIALDDLIAIKRALGRPKDLLVSTELEAIRERLRSRDS